MKEYTKNLSQEWKNSTRCYKNKERIISLQVLTQREMILQASLRQALTLCMNLLNQVFWILTFTHSKTIISFQQARIPKLSSLIGMLTKSSKSLSLQLQRRKVQSLSLNLLLVKMNFTASLVQLMAQQAFGIWMLLTMIILPATRLLLISHPLLESLSNL